MYRESRFKELQEFHKVQGHCRVPRNRAEYKVLGEWVHSQRHNKKIGVKALEGERTRLLDGLGFNWAPER